MSPRLNPRRDFFVSYTKADHLWAKGIGDWLEEAGYSVFMQDPDFHAGSNFVLKMQEGTSTCDRTIAVVSPPYLESDFTPSEWAAAFAKDPKGEKGTLVLVIVRATDLPGLLGQIRYINLADMNADAARAKLLSELQSLRTDHPIPKRVRRSKVPVSQTESPVPPVSIKIGRTGNNATIAGRDVIKTDRVTVHHTFTPGPQHITERQAHQIQELIRDLAGIDEKAGKGNTFPKWQTRFKRKFDLETYRALLAEQAGTGLSTLRQWKAIARRSLRRKDNPSWRNELYTAIYAAWHGLGHQKEAIYPFAYDYLALKKPITSLKELKDSGLEKLCRHVTNMK